MKEMTVQEMKDLQVEILSKVHGFCCENGIRYSMAYGTLIGAVRHKGYIPWDDDIDLLMPRPDYDRFIHSFNGTDERLTVFAPELNWDFYAPYANVCDQSTLLDEGKNNSHRGIAMGVKIDIFPIDGTATEKETYMKDKAEINGHWVKILSYKKASTAAIFRKFGLRAALKCLLYKVVYSPLPYAKLQKRINSLARKHGFDNSDFADLMCYSIMKDSRVKKTLFESYAPMEFEGRKFMALTEYDAFLHKIYGDYMQLPPEEKRVTHHTFKAYRKD